MSELIYKIKKLWAYAKVIWKEDYDWDYSGIYYLLRIKLSRLKHEMENGYHKHPKKHTKRIDLCLLLIDRITKDEYRSPWYSKTGYHRMWDASNSSEFVKAVKALNDKERLHRVRHHKHVSMLLAQDNQLLFSTIAKYIRNWWD